jgi:hypothetical protein
MRHLRRIQVVSALATALNLAMGDTWECYLTGSSQVAVSVCEWQ